MVKPMQPCCCPAMHMASGAPLACSCNVTAGASGLAQAPHQTVRFVVHIPFAMLGGGGAGLQGTGTAAVQGKAADLQRRKASAMCAPWWVCAVLVMAPRTLLPARKAWYGSLLVTCRLCGVPTDAELLAKQARIVQDYSRHPDALSVRGT